MFPLPLFYYFEFGALVTSVLVLYKFDHQPLRWFIPFLCCMVGVELYGWYLRVVSKVPNTWLYNISIPVEYVFYGFIIGSLCITKKFKQWIFIATIVFAVYAVINNLFIQGAAQLDTDTLKIGSSLMIVFSGIGLVDLFKNDEHQTLLLNPLFWICAAVLFFNTGEFLYFFFFDIFLQNHWDKTAKVFASINNKLVYVLYTCISIAIVCSKKLVKKA